jgi:acyl-CoA synthetase (AMP-forming)/AMP-acid ligase II
MNLAMILDMAADGFGDRVAIGSRDGAGFTYAQVREHAEALARAMRASGAGNAVYEDRNSRFLSIALFGAAWAGLSYAPVNYRLPAATRAELVARLQPAFELDADGDIDLHDEELLPYDPDPERPAVLLFTSGTTAAPKAAVLGHDQLLAYLFNTVEFGSADEDEAALLAVPPFHIAGVASLLSSTYACRRIVPLPDFSAEEWITAAAREHVTHAMLVPTMLARIVTALDTDPHLPRPAVRSIAYGGARMPAPVLERALELFPETSFVNAYGLTETSSTIAILGPEEHRAAAAGDDVARRRLASVGKPVPGIEVRVVEGVIHVRGDQVSGKYLEDPSRVDPDGWLVTGDLGHVDDGGYIFVTGRADDMIIRGGENISPSEIEDMLLRHPCVAHVAVVGLPDVQWGERVAAMVVPMAGTKVTQEDLATWCRGHIGSLKTPELIVFRDELPHTPTGKILRRQVRAELAQ